MRSRSEFGTGERQKRKRCADDAHLGRHVHIHGRHLCRRVSHTLGLLLTRQQRPDTARYPGVVDCSLHGLPQNGTTCYGYNCESSRI